MVNSIFLIAIADILFGVALMEIWDKPFLRTIGGIVALVGTIYVVWFLASEIKGIIIT